MSAQPSHSPGRKWLSRSRVLVTDVIWLHREVPTCAHQMEFQLAALSAAREAVNERISWPALFLKAYAAVSARHAPLLQTWRKWPLAHVFQHVEPIATVAVSRRYQNEDWLLWGKLKSPYQMPLPVIQAALDRFTDGPVEEVFRQQLQLSMLPTPLRRFVWWCNLNLYGDKRTKRTGTFLLSTLANRGVDNPHPPSFLTSSITYGALQADGRCLVSLVYDHRLMDGQFVADRLQELEAELNGAILDELRSLATSTEDRIAA